MWQQCGSPFLAGAQTKFLDPLGLGRSVWGAIRPVVEYATIMSHPQLYAIYLHINDFIQPPVSGPLLQLGQAFLSISNANLYIKSPRFKQTVFTYFNILPLSVGLCQDLH